jgi:hypothetical protein
VFKVSVKEILAARECGCSGAEDGGAMPVCVGVGTKDPCADDTPANGVCKGVCTGVDGEREVEPPHVFCCCHGGGGACSGGGGAAGGPATGAEVGFDRPFTAEGIDGADDGAWPLAGTTSG